jgi:hypothetical protein
VKVVSFLEAHAQDTVACKISHSILNLEVSKMQTNSAVGRIAGVLIASVALTFDAYAAEPAGHHEHGAAGLTALKLNSGKKWGTDEPLRKGMAEIRNAVAADKETIHAGKMSAAKYDVLANKIDGQVAYVVQNCKRPPEADAQLHMILAEMAQGLDAARGKDKKVNRRAGVENIIASLGAYNKNFDHPGWRALN